MIDVIFRKSGYVSVMSEELMKAKRKIMDLVARRDHSAKELQQKLAKFYEQTTIVQAIEWAHAQGWMKNEAEVAERTAQALGRKLKGRRYIQNYLHEKGLPHVALDSNEELEKAKELVRRKFRNFDDSNVNAMSREEKAKIGRFLGARGFDLDVIRKIIWNSGD